MVQFKATNKQKGPKDFFFFGRRDLKDIYYLIQLKLE